MPFRRVILYSGHTCIVDLPVILHVYLSPNFDAMKFSDTIFVLVATHTIVPDKCVFAMMHSCWGHHSSSDAGSAAKLDVHVAAFI